MRTALLFLSLVIAPAAGAVPLTLSHQGRVLDAAGDPVEGATSVTFRLFDAPTGGAAVWSETQTPTFADGYFSVVLGSVTPLDPDDFAVPLYLSLDVGGTALLGRTPLSSVPYALRAGSVEGGAVDAEEIRVDGQLVIAADGTIDWSHLSGLPSPLLADLTCGSGQILEYGTSGWQCADLTVDASDLLGGTVPISVLPVGGGADEVAAGDHRHDAADLISGKVSISRLSVGTTSTDVSRGDHTHDAGGIVSGKLAVARLPVGTTNADVAAGDHTHDAAGIVSGKIAVARLPVGPTSADVAAGDHTHDAGGIVSGKLAVARLPVGATSADVAAGDHTHGTIGAVTFGQTVTAVAGPLSVGATAVDCDDNAVGWLRVVTTPVVALELCDGERWASVANNPGTAPNTAGASCLDLYTRGVRADGPYWIDPPGGAQTAPFQAYCDMTTDGGGWTLVHKTNKVGDGDRTDTGFNVAALLTPAADATAFMHRTTVNKIGSTYRIVTTDGKKMFWEGSDYYTTGTHATLRPMRAKLSWAAPWFESSFVQQNPSGHAACLGSGTSTAQEHICTRRWCCGEPSQGLWLNGGAWSTGAYYAGTGWVR